MKVVIGFSRHKGFAPLSWLISMFMGESFSHTYFKFKEERFEDSTIFHAVGKGLTYISETNFNIHNKVVAEFELEVSEEIYSKLLLKCHNKSGIEDYGTLQNLGIVVVDFLNKFRSDKIKNNPFKSGENCSEWIFEVLESIYGIWTDTDKNMIRPDEIYDFLRNNYGKT